MFFEKQKTKPQYRMGLIMSIWESVVGNKIYENTKIINIKKNILLIKTTTPIWRNELLFQKKDILNRLNKTQKTILIKDIHFI